MDERLLRIEVLMASMKLALHIAEIHQDDKEELQFLIDKLEDELGFLKEELE